MIGFERKISGSRASEETPTHRKWSRHDVGKVGSHHNEVRLYIIFNFAVHYKLHDMLEICLWRFALVKIYKCMPSTSGWTRRRRRTNLPTAKSRPWTGNCFSNRMSWNGARASWRRRRPSWMRPQSGEMSPQSFQSFFKVLGHWFCLHLTWSRFKRSRL